MMAHGKLRELRALAVAQAAMQVVEVTDIQHFIDSGELDGSIRQVKLPYDPAVAAHMAKIIENGGKFVMPEGV